MDFGPVAVSTSMQIHGKHESYVISNLHSDLLSATQTTTTVTKHTGTVTDSCTGQDASTALVHTLCVDGLYVVEQAVAERALTCRTYNTQFSIACIWVFMALARYPYLTTLCVSVMQRDFALKHLPDDPMFKLVSKLYETVPGVLQATGKVRHHVIFAVACT